MSHPDPGADRAKILATNIALREHLNTLTSTSVLAPGGSCPRGADKSLEENDRLLEETQTVIHQGLLVQAFGLISAATRGEAARLKAGLGEYSAAALVERLKAGSCMRRGEGDVEGDRDDDVLDLARLGEKAAADFRVFDTVDAMFGPMEVEAKARKAVDKEERAREREARMAGRAGGVGVARALQHEDGGRTNETDRQIMAMAQKLREVRRAGFYDFVIDPDNFSRSVENIFHCSFLIKDGRAKIIVEDGVIVLVDKATAVAQGRGDTPGKASQAARVEAQQMVLKFDRKTWMAFKSQRSMDKAMFPMDKKESLRRASAAK